MRMQRFCVQCAINAELPDKRYTSQAQFIHESRHLPLWWQHFLAKTCIEPTQPHAPKRTRVYELRSQLAPSMIALQTKFKLDIHDAALMLILRASLLHQTYTSRWKRCLWQSQALSTHVLVHSWIWTSAIFRFVLLKRFCCNDLRMLFEHASQGSSQMCLLYKSKDDNWNT